MMNGMEREGDILQTVRTGYFELAWRNNRLYDDLSKILKIFRQESIPVILLKGAHLARIVYGNIALRPMGDIDILVRKSDLVKAEKALLELDWETVQARAREWGVGNAVYLTLYLAKSLPGAEVPDALLNELRAKNCTESVAKGDGK